MAENINNPAEPMLNAMPPITLALILLNVLVHALGLATGPEIVRVFGQWPGFGRELFGKRYQGQVLPFAPIASPAAMILLTRETDSPTSFAIALNV